MDVRRRIGKKPPDMIGLPISKPSRVVLDFFVLFCLVVGRRVACG